MEIQFKVAADDLRKALDTIQIVKPMPCTQDGGVGYLFVVGKKGDQDFCWVYSRDPLHSARAEFPIREVQGEGPFIYPADRIDGFKYAQGEFEFATKSEGDVHTVRYSYGKNDRGSASTEHATFDPKLLTPLDKRLRDAPEGTAYCTAPLRSAIMMSSKFLASESDRNAKDEFKVINIYQGDKGDGTLVARNDHQGFFFWCEDFLAKGLQIHADHVSVVTNFLAKCGTKVTIKPGKDTIFATDEENRVLGWAVHAKPALPYKYYPRDWDTVVLKVKKEQTIQQLRWIQTQMETGRIKVKVRYEPVEGSTEGTLRFHVAEGGKSSSLPIDATFVEGSNEKFEYNVNIGMFIELFDGTKANEVELRVSPLDKHGLTKGMGGLRTIDVFVLNSEGAVVGGSGVPSDPANGTYQCKVTRFMTTMV